MDSRRDDYVKANAYDLAKQKHNFGVFKLALRRRPAAALILAALWLALAVAAVFAPELGVTGLAEPIRRWPLAALAFCAAVWTLVIVFGSSQGDRPVR